MQNPEYKCPVCYESKFPLVGSCGHSICEVCERIVNDCPVCRAVDSFKNPAPNWTLANSFGIKRTIRRSLSSPSSNTHHISSVNHVSHMRNASRGPGFEDFCFVVLLDIIVTSLMISIYPLVY